MQLTDEQLAEQLKRWIEENGDKPDKWNKDANRADLAGRIE